MSFYEFLPWLMTADAVVMGYIMQGVWTRYKGQTLDLEMPE